MLLNYRITKFLSIPSSYRNVLCGFCHWFALTPLSNVNEQYLSITVTRIYSKAGLTRILFVSERIGFFTLSPLTDYFHSWVRLISYVRYLQFFATAASCYWVLSHFCYDKVHVDSALKVKRELQQMQKRLGNEGEGAAKVLSDELAQLDKDLVTLDNITTSAKTLK